MILVGAVCGCTGIFTGMYLGSQQARPTPRAPVFEAQVVIAVVDIPAGTVVDGDMVGLFDYPADYVIETMVTDMSWVIGRRAGIDIPRGVVVTTGMLEEPEP